MSVVAHDFIIEVSVLDLLVESESTTSANPVLASFLEACGLTIDLVALSKKYIDETFVGAGDVFISRSDSQPGNAIVFDMFRFPEDQLDLITIGFKSSPESQAFAAKELLKFFVGCRTQVSFSMDSYSILLRDLMDSFSYPKLKKLNNYVQNLVEI